MNPTILKHPEHPKAKPARAVRRIPGYRIIVGECLRFATGIAFERIGMEMKKLSGGKLRAAGYDERRRVLVVELDAGRFEYSGVTRRSIAG